MRSWLNDGDTFIVDRGFRDSADVLSDIGIRMEMPCFHVTHNRGIEKFQVDNQGALSGGVSKRQN